MAGRWYCDPCFMKALQARAPADQVFAKSCGIAAAALAIVMLASVCGVIYFAYVLSQANH